MKIGILTWYFGMNHGARAHTFALQQIVRSMKYDVQIVRYRSWKNYSVEKNVYSKNPYRFLQKIIYRLRFWAGENCFNKSRLVHSVKAIDALNYDCIILGSDEIFNIQHELVSNDWTYYGVGIKNTPLITYAVSSGQMDPDYVLADEIKESIKKIRFLSVRDYSTKDLIYNNTGLKATVVLDPTLLYEFESEYSQPNNKNKGYLLIYAFGYLDRYKEKIIKYAKEKKLVIYCIGRALNWADYDAPMISQHKWYEAFRNANVIITDSFHGAIFSIKYQKDFIILGHKDKQRKVYNLFKQLDIKKKPIEENQEIDSYLLETVNYEKVFENLQQLRKESFAYLKGALECI